MLITYYPVTNMKFADWADKYGLSLVIERVLEACGSKKFRASLMKDGKVAITTRGYGDTPWLSVVALIDNLNGKQTMFLEAPIVCPSLIKGQDLHTQVQAAVAAV